MQSECPEHENDRLDFDVMRCVHRGERYVLMLGERHAPDCRCSTDHSRRYYHVEYIDQARDPADPDWYEGHLVAEPEATTLFEHYVARMRAGDGPRERGEVRAFADMLRAKLA